MAGFEQQQTGCGHAIRCARLEWSNTIVRRLDEFRACIRSRRICDEPGFSVGYTCGYADASCDVTRSCITHYNLRRRRRDRFCHHAESCRRDTIADDQS